MGYNDREYNFGYNYNQRDTYVNGLRSRDEDDGGYLTDRWLLHRQQFDENNPVVSEDIAGIKGRQGTFERMMLDRSLQLLGDANTYRGLQREALDDSTSFQRRQDAVGRAQTDFTMAFDAARDKSTNNIGRIQDQAVARARGLTRSAIASENALQDKGVQDRIAYSRFLRGRASQAITGAEQQIDMEQQLGMSAHNARGAVAASNANMYGSLVGAGISAAGLAYDKWKDSRPPSNTVSTQGAT